MTTNELQIGDWVKEENGFPMFVQAIYGDDTVYLDFDGNEGDTWEVDIKDLRAIPISQELLIGLGFKSFKGGPGTWNMKLEIDDHLIHIEQLTRQTHAELHAIIKNAREQFHTHIKVTYLHELQNIVRLITSKELEVNL